MRRNPITCSRGLRRAKRVPDRAGRRQRTKRAPPASCDGPGPLGDGRRDPLDRLREVGTEGAPGGERMTAAAERFRDTADVRGALRPQGDLPPPLGRLLEEARDVALADAPYVV